METSSIYFVVLWHLSSLAKYDLGWSFSGASNMQKLIMSWTLCYNDIIPCEMLETEADKHNQLSSA